MKISSTAAEAVSGMKAAQTRLDVAAHNTANGLTEGFVRQEVTQSTAAGGGTRAQVRPAPQPGADPVADALGQLQARNAFLANLQVFKTQDRMAGSLLDLRA